VTEGHPANFSCKATGVPEPRFSWTFNDGDLPSGISQTSVTEGSFLELPKTTKQMEGIYMCTAENKANTTNSSAYLHVFGKDRKIVYFIPGGRGDSYMTRCGMLLVSPSGVNEWFWSRLGCSGPNATICSY